MDTKKELEEDLDVRSHGAILIMDSQIIPIVAEVLNLGRHFDNDIVIGSESVSRRHSHIRFEFGQFVLYDNNSTSGTFVNNKRINRCVLHSGDLISLAEVKIMFVHDRSQMTDFTKRSTKSFDGNGDL